MSHCIGYLVVFLGPQKPSKGIQSATNLLPNHKTSTHELGWWLKKVNLNENLETQCST